MPLLAALAPNALNFDGGLSILIGLLLLILIFALLLFYSLRGKSVVPKRKIPETIKAKCPVCKGATKLPDQPPDSADIQFIPCGNCDGTGETMYVIFGKGGNDGY